MKTLSIVALLLVVGCAGKPDSNKLATTSVVVNAAPAGTVWATVKADFTATLDKGNTKFGGSLPLYSWYYASQRRQITTNMDNSAVTLTPGVLETTSITLSENTVVNQRYVIYFQANRSPNDWDFSIGAHQFHLNFNNAYDDPTPVTIKLGTAEYHNGPTNDTVAYGISNQIILSRWIATTPITIGYFRVFQDAE